MVNILSNHYSIVYFYVEIYLSVQLITYYINFKNSVSISPNDTDGDQ